jgi:tetratricopeptide (TPR) repeat protein
MGMVLRMVLLLGVLGAAGVARADNKTAARESFREGTRQYDLNEFKLALDAFKRAYLQYEEPAFLFNIAQCHRQLGEKPEAVKFYRTYLRKVPAAQNRDEVERIIATLEAAIEQSVKAKPPTGTIDPNTKPAPEPASPLVTAPRQTTPPPAPPTAIAMTDSGRTKRLAGIALLASGGALLVAGAIFVGMAKLANDDIENPGDGVFDPSAQDRRNTFQALDAVFFAVGGAAAVTGLTLYLIGRRGSHKLAIAPAAGPGIVGASLGGSF